MKRLFVLAILFSAVWTSAAEAQVGWYGWRGRAYYPYRSGYTTYYSGPSSYGYYGYYRPIYGGSFYQPYYRRYSGYSYPYASGYAWGYPVMPYRRYVW